MFVFNPCLSATEHYCNGCGALHIVYVMLYVINAQEYEQQQYHIYSTAPTTHTPPRMVLFNLLHVACI